MWRERTFDLIDADPGRFELISICMRTLARLCATHYHMSGSDADRLVLAVANVLDDIERTLGNPKGD